MIRVALLFLFCCMSGIELYVGDGVYLLKSDTRFCSMKTNFVHK